MVHDDMYNVKCRQMDTLYEPVSFGPLTQIRVNQDLLKVTGVIEFGPI